MNGRLKQNLKVEAISAMKITEEYTLQGIGNVVVNSERIEMIGQIEASE